MPTLIVAIVVKTGVVAKASSEGLATKASGTTNNPPPRRIARHATGSHGVSAMLAAMKTLPHTGGVKVQSSAYQNTKRCACKGGRPRLPSAGPATEMQIT